VGGGEGEVRNRPEALSAGVESRGDEDEEEEEEEEKLVVGGRKGG